MADSAKSVFVTIPVAMLVDGYAHIVGEAQIEVKVHPGIVWGKEEDAGFLLMVDEVKTGG